MANIEINFGTQRVGEITLKDPITGIGRQKGSQICLQHSKVSGTHAKIISELNAFFLEDLGSTNGTFINGKRVEGNIRLRHGDQIAVGEYTLRFVSIGSEEADGAIAEPNNTPIAGDGATMMLKASQLSELLEDHQRTNATKRGKASAWLDIANNNSVPLSRSEFSIGKSKDSDIISGGWFSPKISALIVHMREGYFVRPHRRGKVQINDQIVKDETKLNHGDRIKVQSAYMTFTIKMNN